MISAQPFSGYFPFDSACTTNSSRLHCVTATGGPLMAGFRSGRLYGRSAAVAVLRYSWPMWLSLSGTLQTGVGNVFGEHLEGFRPGRVRLSGAFGLETQGSRDSVFHALVGFATETLESGARLDSIRLLVGVRIGF